MKKCFSFLSIGFAMLLIMASCKDSRPGSTWHPPKPGALIDTAGMKVTDDPLNDFTFSVTIRASTLIDSGTYDVRAAYGHNMAEDQLTMPRNMSQLRPEIRRTDTPYTYIIGFRMNNRFYDYYEVSGNRGKMEMKYIRSYSFD